MTSHSTASVAHAPGTRQPRDPVRVALSPRPGKATLDGAWWPQSRDLASELADLVDHFPVERGRVQRVLYSRPDWDTQPHRVVVARGLIKVGSYPQDDTHLMMLRMSTRTDLRLLVVPPEHPTGTQAMRLAADPANRWSATQILAAGAFDDGHGEDDDEHWTDLGGSWWSNPESGPPSFR
jgi:uncharacterized protein DUF5994